MAGTAYRCLEVVRAAAGAAAGVSVGVRVRFCV